MLKKPPILALERGRPNPLNPPLLTMKNPIIQRQIRKLRSSESGLSLVELIVAMSILSIGVIGFVNSFQYITRSIHISRARTLASNLCQEKIEAIKDKSYHKLQLSTETAVDTNFSPSMVYDKNNEAEETIVIGGLTFKRRTFVAFAEVTNNVISTVTFNYPDTGLKEIRVHTVWQERGKWKKMSLYNIYENPNIDPLNTVVTGCVDEVDGSACGNPISSALVQVMGTDWKDTTDSGGIYSISVHAGTYTIRASSTGFYALSKSNIGLSTGTTTDLDFDIVEMDSGTITGNVWLNPHLVISQLVASTRTFVPLISGNTEDVEYIELFNPTTAEITIYDGSNSLILLDYDDEPPGNNDCDNACFDLVYSTPAVGAFHYYLIASTRVFMINGAMVEADAYYGSPGADEIKGNQGGCMSITDTNDNNIDVLGWCDNATDNNFPYCNVPVNCYETTPIPDDPTNDGLAEGRQFVRTSSPAFVSSWTARSYDSGNNAFDFFYASAIIVGQFYSPHYSVQPEQIPGTGVPGIGAYVSAEDDLGPSATAEELFVTSGSLSLPYAHFELEGVSTGTWTLLISSGANFQKMTDVEVASSGSSTGVPNFSTDPIWVSENMNSVMLGSSSAEGFVAGLVTDVNNVAINVDMDINGQPKTSGANGRYFAQVSSGVITVVANPLNANSLYVESIQQVTVQTGQLTTLDFSLSQGGVISGFVTTDGSSILPGVEFTAEISGAQYGAGTSDSSGYFYINNLGSGTYDVGPALDPSESSTPPPTQLGGHYKRHPVHRDVYDRRLSRHDRGRYHARRRPRDLWRPDPSQYGTHLQQPSPDRGLLRPGPDLHLRGFQ